MRKYVIKRVLQIFLTLFLYLTLVFFILQAMPGDFAAIYGIANPQLRKEVKEQLIRDLGLDKPLHIQYLTYLRNFVLGNWGHSYQFDRPVWDLIKERLPRTVLLFLTATVLSFYFGFLLGKVIAWRRGQLIEYTSTVAGVALWTVFTPMLALLIVWLFALQLTRWTGADLFPVANFLDLSLWLKVGLGPEGSNVVFGYILLTLAGWLLFALIFWLLSHKLFYHPRSRLLANLFANAAALGVIAGIWFTHSPCWPAIDRSLISSAISRLLITPENQVCMWGLAINIAHHMVLPVLTLALISFGGTMLLMRSSMLEVVREDYVMAAKAKGLPDPIVRDKHAARNALLPVATSFVLSLAFAIDGGIITETIFSWPGMGLLLLGAVLEHDFPLAVGALVFTGVFALVAHLVADILYAYLDPRIRYD